MFSIQVQLDNKHKNISNVVSITKNNEIPSIPKVKFILRLGIHINLVTNCISPVDLSNKIHNIRDAKNVKLEVPKEIIFKFL